MTPISARRSFLLRLLLALFVGGGLALSGPPLSQHTLAALPAFFVPPLLLLLVRDQAPGRAALLGVAAGLGFGVYSLRFTLDVLARFADLGTPAALPVWLLLALLQSAPLALALALARLADTPDSSRLHLTLPLALAASFGLVPMLFPWHLGHFTLPWLAWAQQAELGGLPLVDLSTALVGCCALEGLRLRSRPLLFASAAALLLPAFFGYAQLSALAPGQAGAPALRVAVLQPDISIAAIRAGLSPRARFAQLVELDDEAVEAGAQLVLWPEAAYPLPVPRAALEAREAGALSLLSGRRDVRDGQDVQHEPAAARASPHRIVGAMSTAGPCATWNTLVAVDGAGRPVAHVDKRHLFPFAEYVPFWSWSSALRRRFPCRGEREGQGDAVVRVAGTPLGLLNCYEDVHPEPAREATRAGAQLLLNFSNDAWFGRSVQPELHRIVARYRAIETRRDLVRAVNTGASGHISATGEELVVLGRHSPAFAVVDARLLTDITLSVRLGGWLPPLALLVLLGLLGPRALRAARLPLARGGRARQSHDSQA